MSHASHIEYMLKMRRNLKYDVKPVEIQTKRGCNNYVSHVHACLDTENFPLPTFKATQQPTVGTAKLLRSKVFEFAFTQQTPDPKMPRGQETKDVKICIGVLYNTGHIKQHVYSYDESIGLIYHYLEDGSGDSELASAISYAHNFTQCQLRFVEVVSAYGASPDVPCP